MSDPEIERMYLRHRDPFTAWALKHFGLERSDALDVYQEAIVAFVRNVRNGRFDPATAEASTYLFAIGRNLALKQLRDHRGRNTRLVEGHDLHLVLPESEQRMHEEHVQQQVRSGMSKLSEKEKEVLRLYYYEERSMSEIADIMGYSNADVAKKMKYVGFRKLAAFILGTSNTKRRAHAE